MGHYIESLARSNVTHEPGISNIFGGLVESFKSHSARASTNGFMAKLFRLAVHIRVLLPVRIFLYNFFPH
jgi:hypothetical protein